MRKTLKGAALAAISLTCLGAADAGDYQYIGDNKHERYNLKNRTAVNLIAKLERISPLFGTHQAEQEQQERYS